MSVTKITCSKQESAYVKLPGRFTRQPIADLKPGCKYENKYIQGFVSMRWDLQYKSGKPHLLKLTLNENNGPPDKTSKQAISLFCFGDVAKELDEMQKGNFLIVVGFTVEQSSRDDSVHPCQVCVDEKNGNIQIWLVDIQGPGDVVCDKVIPQDQGSEASKTKGKVSSYTYTSLRNLEVNTRVNIYAVVKFFKAPYRTRGTDYCQIMSVVDYTCDNLTKLKCLFFIRPPADPPPVKIGSIVRFHRLRVINHNGELQGNNGPGFSWLVFEGEEGATLVPKSSSPNYSLTDSDREKVLALRKWAAGVEALLRNVKPATLADLSPGKYCDIAVQVVSTCVIEEGVCLLLRVWDGTRLLYPVREIDASGENCEPDTDVVLNEFAQGFIYDVCLYDDHSRNRIQIKPGNFIELRNLHAAVYKNVETRDEYNALQTVELVLHKGTSYGRGVFKASPGSREKLELIKRLEAIKEKVRNKASRDCSLGNADSVDAADISRAQGQQGKGASTQDRAEVVNNNNTKSSEVNLSTSGINRQNSNAELNKTYSSLDQSGQRVQKRVSGIHECREDIIPVKGICKDFAHKSMDVDRPFSPELQLSSDPTDELSLQVSEKDNQGNRCMMDTATVLTAHQHIKCSSLSEVIQHKVPYKFRILAKVMDYQPKAVVPENVVKLYCSNCHYVMCPAIEVDVGIRYPACPRCIKESHRWDSDCTPFMEYAFVMKFLLDDGKDSIIANLWRENATVFFRGIKPEEALTDSDSFNIIKKDLLNLLGTERLRPWLECCIKSYTGASGTCYQIFDTTVA